LNFCIGRGRKWAEECRKNSKGSKESPKVLIILILAGIVWGCMCSKTAWAQSTQKEADQGETGQAPVLELDSLEDLLGTEAFDFSEIDRFLCRETTDSTLTLESVMEYLLSGNLSGLWKEILKSLKDQLFAELSTGGRLMGQILGLGILSAVFTNFSTVFQNSQISETGFFITYLLLFTFLAMSLMEDAALAAEVAEDILEFMKVLMPSYFLAVAFAGGSLSAVAMYEFTLWAMAAGQWILGNLILPLVKIYVILGMAGNLAKEEFFSKMTQLLEQIAGWGIKTVPGLVLGFQLIQNLILPYVDSLKQGTVQKAVSMIPGIGQGAAAMTQFVIGSGVLIKNTIGMAAVVILLVLIAVPVLKMVVLLLMYQCVAAVMEPVCDRRFVNCVSTAAKGQKMLLQAVTAAALILVITIAVVCAGTNVTYYA